MDPRTIRQVNELWNGVYPHLARYVLELFDRQEGDVLELGPFAGGIAQALLSQGSRLKIVIAGEPAEVFQPLEDALHGTPRAQSLMVKPSALAPLIFLDQSFDLVIFRGAFFFLSPAILREIYRVLRPGGLAVVGGGYGPFAPASLIEAIGARSKRLNQQLGKKWVTPDEVTHMLQETALEAEISEDGGLWVLIRREAETGQRDEPDLRAALSVGSREIASFVGAGGKTTLMFRLAQEFVEAGCSVISTTTTKIFVPTKEQTPCLVVEEDPAKLMELVERGLHAHGHVTVAARRFSGGKIGGIDPELVGRMIDELPVDYVLVEADGAKKLPLKAPGDHEPVLPSRTSLLIPVVGVDAVGRSLNDDSVFRPERVVELTGTEVGDPITPQMVACVITHPRGLIKNVPATSRIVPLLNKVETPEGLVAGRAVAQEVLEQANRRLERVVLGRLFFCHPVLEVITRDGEQ